MLDGWYCRSIANEAAQAEEEERAQEESRLKKQYKFLKGKFKHLLYENECFQQALRLAQKQLLTVTRDRNFLLDRLMLYERPDNSTSESEETDSSEDETNIKIEPTKKRKTDHYMNSHSSNGSHISGKVIQPVKKKRIQASKTISRSHLSHHQHQQTIIQLPCSSNSGILADGHMTPEEVEKHLQSRQSFMDLERAPPTVPTEMFSNEPSLDSESNDIGELETSPSNMGEELSIDMIGE